MGDTSDSPRWTERELAQSFLIDNVSQILNLTGRSKGFPNETLSGEEVLGPFPVAITRIVSDGRGSHGGFTTADRIDTDDFNTLINAFTPKQNLDFLDIPENIMDLLTPRVELYKVYPYGGEEGGTFDVLFRPEWLKPEGRGSKLKKKNTQVGLTGLTIKKLGGNIAQAESNIVISVEIATMDLNNLFYRYRPPEMGSVENPVEVPGVLQHHGVAWIDLIKMVPETVATSNACSTRGYNEEQTKLKIKIGYNKIGNEMRGAIRDALTANTIVGGPTPEMLTRWEAAGTPISGELKRAAQTGFSEPVRDESGNDPLVTLVADGQIDAAIDQIIDAVNSHEEGYSLNLKNHDLIVDTDLTVKMTINFIGSSEVLQRTDKADLLNDPDIQTRISELEGQLETLEGELGENEVVVAADNASEEEVEAIDAQNQDREECRTRIEDEMSGVQSSIQNQILMSKRKLYEQLRLVSLDKSRIYTMAIPAMRSGHGRSSHEGEARLNVTGRVDITSNTGQGFNAALGSGAANATRYYIKNYANRGEMEALMTLIGTPNTSRIATGGGTSTDRPDMGDVGEREAAFDAEQSEYSEEMGTEEGAEARRTFEEEELATLVASGQYKFINFVFLGDIIDAALEIVAKNNGYFPAESASEPEEPEEEPDTAPAGVMGAISHFARGVMDRVQGFFDEIPHIHGPTFFEELQEDGNVGPAAQKTIHHFGKYLLGDIALPRKSNESSTTHINIADIPIDLERFRTMWFHNVIAKPQTKRYYLQNLINNIINELAPYAIASRPRGSTDSVVGEMPMIALNYFSLPGLGSELNAQARNEKVTNPAVIEAEALAARSLTRPTYVPPATGFVNSMMVDSGLNYVTPNYLSTFPMTTPVEDPSSVSNFNFGSTGAEWLNGPAAPDANSTDSWSFSANTLIDDGEYCRSVPTRIPVRYITYMSTSALRNAVSSIDRSSIGTQMFNVFVIHQKPEHQVHRSGDETKDRGNGVYHFKLSDSEKKALLNIQFKRQDMPAIQVANLMADSGVNRLGILREKYNASLLLRGNIVYKPGSLLYVEPAKLQGIPLSVNEDDYNRYGSGLVVSAARTLGIGGYFNVITVTHEFGTLGRGGKWRTTLDAMWNSFEWNESLSCEASENVESTGTHQGTCVDQPTDPTRVVYDTGNGEVSVSVDPVQRASELGNQDHNVFVQWRQEDHGYQGDQDPAAFGGNVLGGPD